MNGEKKTIKTLRVIIIAGLMIGLAVVNTLPANPLRSEASASDFGELSRTEPVKVAILDSGSNTAYKEGISLIDGTVKDYNGHGTLMAKIIRESNPDAELYIVKVMGKNGLAINEEAVILGLQWAISRDVDVINMSLRLKESARLHQTIKKAYDRGIVIVAAAGNTTSRWSMTRRGVLNTQASTEQFDPESFDPESLKTEGLTAEGLSRTSGTVDNLTARLDSAKRAVRQVTQYEVAYPAKYKEVIAVGALDRYGRVYDGSIEGEEVDVHCKGYRGRKAGTSIASAYAAGLAAKIISENPDSNITCLSVDRQEVKNIMRQTCPPAGRSPKINDS